MSKQKMVEDICPHLCIRCLFPVRHVYQILRNPNYEITGSLRLLYKVYPIELDLQPQLHQAVLFSHYSLSELSKGQLFLVEIPPPAFQGLARV